MTPMEVVKIRLQAQQHSLADPLEAPRYRNAGHAVYTIVREEGIATLYRGVSLTALRQATNQGALTRPLTSARTEYPLRRRELHRVPGAEDGEEVQSAHLQDQEQEGDHRGQEG